MKRLSSILMAAAMVFVAHAEVNYQVIPLPQSIQLDASGNSALLIKGQGVAYPAENAKMLRNAQFAQEYLGLVPELASKKSKAIMQISLGLQNPNPDAYAITINKKGISIQGASESGVFYAIQTLRKSIEGEKGDTIRLPFVTITDEPRFGYRGVMLDCARHFFPIEYIKKYIDIMALHGVNKFHWHLTDDQGWRFEVKSLPELAKKAGYRPHTILGKNIGVRDADNTLFDDTPEEGYYTQNQIKAIVEYAAERYITIIPEIDLPGHMVAALSVYPELGCTGGPYSVWCQWGISHDVLCAGNPKTLEFLKKVYSELCDVFPRK